MWKGRPKPGRATTPQRRAEEKQSLVEAPSAAADEASEDFARERSKEQAQPSNTTERDLQLRSVFSRWERLKMWATSVLTSGTMQAFYVLMGALTLLLLVLTLAHSPTVLHSHWFVGLDVAITAGLFLEVVLRILLHQRRYLSLVSNLFDTLVLVLSLVSMAFFIRGDHILQVKPWYLDLSDLTATALRVLRDVLRILRLVVLVRHHTDLRRTRNEEINIRIGFVEQASELEDSPSHGIEMGIYDNSFLMHTPQVGTEARRGRTHDISALLDMHRHAEGQAAADDGSSALAADGAA